MLDCTNVCGKITDNIAVDCTLQQVKSIEQEVILLNRCSIENFDLDLTGQNHCVTNIDLLAGENGVRFTALFNKVHLSAGFEFVQSDEGFDEYSHNLALRVYNMTKANLAFIRELGKGANIVAITLDKTDTANDNAYKVYGGTSGLVLSEITFNTNENSGSVLLTLSSREPDLEPLPPLVWLETDRATTDAQFAALAP